MKYIFLIPMIVLFLVAIASSAYVISLPAYIGGPMNLPNPTPGFIIIISCWIVAFVKKIIKKDDCINLIMFVAIFLPSLINFVQWPPVNDGAYFIVRYGRDHPLVDLHAPPNFFNFVFLFWISFLFLYTRFIKTKNDLIALSAKVILTIIGSYLFVWCGKEIIYFLT